ncbi:uncharacterized protein GLRG_00784 [Colletotrichum graminicola M1.001]|uniref:Uncharacterized protein n=1 Tax=Colletotrichum graminicola (strain M1.001 / M2 / FGSC 10212) TaxID=645133 RepID=E3Q3N8_COLGM|nr:uncharacterized protein GLRG_00784 [Colletotrichum graminicola M1.001]EFQ25640.1 hypothetical protein GLRG_00784 [Colletotrichum graminicola M1.001]
MPSIARLILLTATLAAMVQAAPVASSSEPGVTILSAEEVEPHTGPVVPVSAPDGILSVVSEIAV